MTLLFVDMEFQGDRMAVWSSRRLLSLRGRVRELFGYNGEKKLRIDVHALLKASEQVCSYLCSATRALSADHFKGDWPTYGFSKNFVT